MYCEFGVFRGETINHIAKQVTTTIYGFDSFKGLPEDWKCFSKGHFSLRDGELPRCEKNVELIPGWFDVTLPAFAHDHPEPVLFLHVDCDLYSSTKTILFHLGERLGPGSVIVFDEYFNYPGWKKHEHLAFQEYVTSSGRCFEYVCYNRFSEQVAVKIL